MLIIMPSGTNLCYKNECGIFFWGAHGHDAIWHLALSGSAFTTIPFNLPLFSGESLHGYNYLFDLIIFIFSLLKIPIIFLYFKIFPLVWFVSMTHLTVRLARKIHDSQLFVGLYLFFTFFAGSFGYVLSLKNTGTLWESSSLLAMQSGHTLINPPYAVSLLFILGILNILVDKKNILYSHVFLGLLVFFCFAFKFYAGAIGFVLVASHYFFTVIQTKKVKGFIQALLILIIFSLLSIFLFYDPIGATKSGSTFVLSPLSLIHPFIEEKKLFYMEQTVLARYFLQEHGIGPRLIYIESLTFALFMIFNFGTRILGFLYVGYLLFRRKITTFDFSMLGAIVGGILMTSLFVQKGEWWNTIQFFYYSLFLSNLFIARLIYKLLVVKKMLLTCLVFIILVATIPINIDLVRDFTGWPSPSYVSNTELEALSYLRTMPSGIVLTIPHSKSFKSGLQAPYPLFAYDDTSYVSAFSEKKTYVTNETQLRLLGTDYKKRLENVKIANCEVLDTVDYVYELKQIPFFKSYKKCDSTFKVVFQNSVIRIMSK